jgi:diaminopimelate epimerase
MNLHFIKYSATGNIIGVAYYSDVFDIEEFVNNSEARKNLKGLAVKNFCDSVMVLIKNHQSILQTIVFEPNSGSDYGVFSTMCGNGVRAIAKYAEENLKFSNWPLLLNTKSGTLQIEKLRGNTYRVLMGNIVTSKSALSSYVNKAHFSENSDLTGIKIPPTLLDKINTLNFSPHGAICSVGFNTTEIDIYKADGEPHMIIELDRNYIKNIKELKLIAQNYGPVI